MKPPGAPTFKYRKLTRPIASVGSYTSLWLGDDHVMLVRSTGYSESYVRFMFSDIQGLFLAPSSRRRNWNLFWGFVAACSGIIFATHLTSEDPPIVSGVLLAISTIFLVVNSALGPTCKAYLVTRVQTLQLAPLVRDRRAEKIIRQLSPLINSAQADLTQDAAAVPPAAS